MQIKVLGSGCPTCKSLEKAVMNAVAEMNVDADVSKVQDMAQIMQYKVMRTPALVINEKGVMSGRVPTPAELKELIRKEL